MTGVRIPGTVALLAIALVGSGCVERGAVRDTDAVRGGERLELPRDPTTLAAALGVVPESLRAAALERYNRQSYDSARAILAVELSRARGQSDSAAQARALMWLGLAHWRLGDYESARRDGEASLALKRRLALDAELARSFNALGLLAMNEGKHRLALQHFDSAVAAAIRNGDKPGVARASANIPLVLVGLGDFDAARTGFVAARDAAHAVDDGRVEANAVANLAMLEIRLGNSTRALDLLGEARRLYDADEYVTGTANALGQAATALADMGDITGAISAADSGLRLAREHGLKQEVAATLEVIADLYARTGNTRLALGRLHEADSLDAELGLAVERGTNLRRGAAILVGLGEPAAAARRAEEALRVHTAAESGAEAAYDRLQLAEALSLAGDSRRANREIGAALADARRLGSASALRDATVLAARLRLVSGDAKGALQLTEGSRNPDWRVADVRASSDLALGRLDAARTEGERAVAALERERASLGAGAMRSSFFASRVGPYSRLVAIHLARGDTAAAFGVAAMLPGRGIAERLAGANDAARPLASAVEGERVLRRVAALEDELSRAESESQRTALGSALERERASYEETLLTADASAGRRYLGITRPRVAEVQRQLASDEAVLLLLSGPERLDVFVLRSHSLRHRSVAMTDREVAERVRLLRSALNGTRGRDVPAGLREWYETLLAPFVSGGALRDATQLLVVPHGALGALPFAALWNAANGRFVVEDYVVRMVPAVGALADRGSEASAIGRIEVFAPMTDALRGTAREARAIAALLPTATVWTGRASTEARVHEALGRGDAVHIAGHGAHNPQNPLFSFVTVGMKSRSADGVLRVHEILALQTRSPLVFLSGCETGLGSAGADPFVPVNDEGSLSQALLSAGARSVVATLWPVSDTIAADVAVRFYRRLATRPDPAVALAEAQRAMLKNGSNHDFTWSAYTVAGVSRANPR
jgi:CHAT domain-containing protein